MLIFWTPWCMIELCWGIILSAHSPVPQCPSNDADHLFLEVLLYHSATYPESSFVFKTYHFDFSVHWEEMRKRYTSLTHTLLDTHPYTNLTIVTNCALFVSSVGLRLAVHLDFPRLLISVDRLVVHVLLYQMFCCSQLNMHSMSFCFSIALSGILLNTIWHYGFPCYA